jgi:BolA family transcriptional regulator, general stress-responsive regulator
MTNQERVQLIKQKLVENFSPVAINVIDDSSQHLGHKGAASGAGHFTVEITAAAFAGKSLLERHRLIYAALDDLMHSEIHALSIKATSP